MASSNTLRSDLALTIFHENRGINFPFTIVEDGKPENPKEDNSDDEETDVKYFDCWFFSRMYPFKHKKTNTRKPDIFYKELN